MRWQVKKNEFGRAQISGTRQAEIHPGFRTLWRDKIAAEIKDIACRNAGALKLPVIACGVIRADNNCRKPLLSLAEPEGGIAGGEDIAGKCLSFGCLALTNGERLQECPVGKIDAGILGAKGVHALRRHDKPQPLMPLLADGKVQCWKNKVI